MISVAYSGCGKDIWGDRCGDYAKPETIPSDVLRDSAQKQGDAIRIYCGDCGAALLDDEVRMDDVLERARRCPRKFLTNVLAEAMRDNYEANPSVHRPLQFLVLGKYLRQRVPCLCGTCREPPQKAVQHVDGFKTISDIVDEVLDAHKSNKP